MKKTIKWMIIFSAVFCVLGIGVIVTSSEHETSEAVDSL